MAKRSVIIVGFVLNTAVFFALGFVAGRYVLRDTWTWKGRGQDIEAMGGYIIGNEAPKARVRGEIEAGIGAQPGAAIGSAVGGDTESSLIGAGTGSLNGNDYIIGNEADKARVRGEIEASRKTPDTKLVYVHNSNGSITPVKLRRMGDRWIGPRGEQYPTLPTPEQLRPIYGF